MDATASLAAQLQALVDDPECGKSLAADLHRIGTDLAAAVPSLLAVSIVLPRFGGESTVSALLPNADSEAVVRASVAVPMSAGEPGELLVLRAAAAGAFLLLVDDLSRRPGPSHPLELDRHLAWPVAVDEVLERSLADLAAVNRGIGVLLDRGWPPEAAREELHRRAGEAGVTIAAAARRLLRSRTSEASADPG